MYKEQIYDAATNQITWRDYTEEEIAQVEKAKLEADKRAAEVQAKENARISALAKLAALGLTEDEIAAL